MVKNFFKYFSRVVVVVLGLMLSGCSLINDTENVETRQISKSKNLLAKDIAFKYNIKGRTLSTYINKDDPKVSYVNIAEFITFMDGGIVDLNISKSDVMTISYSIDVPSEYQEAYGPTYRYEMTIDAANEVISYNDFDMVSIINVPTKYQYETELIISDIDFNIADPSLDINLSLYNMDIVLFEDSYYIPLYLANLFFTGSNINVYEMNNYIYIIDDVTDFNKLINNFEKDYNISASDINSHTKNYLALYFDYFYGLKDYKNIDTYRDILDNYSFEKSENFHSLHRELERFIISQNDLHTSLISAGYMNKDFTPSAVQSNKLSKYVADYTTNQCNYRKSEVDYWNYEDTLVIQVNGFSLKTRSLLKPAMEEAKNYDDIIIDVSCNPGGIIIGVVELLSYMTDENIPVSYINPTTGEKIIEYYESTDNVSLDKNFYVYTTAASFSAANLFTSIVKDQELGIIFGKRSGGGACAITYTVLPDGAIIVNSSNMTFINEDSEVIEDGIDVDINYNIPFNIDDFNNRFVNSSEILINKTSEVDSISYDFDIDRDLNITAYILSVYDYETNELLSKELFTSDDFTYNLVKPKGNVTYKIEASVKYILENYTKEEIIYTDIVDDHSNTFDLNATELSINEKTDAHSHITMDNDAFKFTVMEKGLYRIELDDDKQLEYHNVYDETGNLVGKGFDFQLEPGVYYLVATIRRIGDYSIEIKKMEDDNTGPTIINLQEGIQQHKLYYDYLFDDESFEVNVPEDSLVTFTWTSDINYEYSIIKNDDKLFSYKTDELHTSEYIEIILPKGTYIVKLNDRFALGELKLTTTLTTDFVDYSGDTSLESDNYGELNIGTNTIELYLADMDVYYIDIKEAGSYVFRYSQGFVKYINSDGTFKYMFSNYFINLTPGRHYFVFENYRFEKNPNIDFELILDIDLNNEQNMDTIYVDQEISTIISNSTDIDYFMFYSSERKTYKLNISGFTSGKFTIVDLMGNQIGSSGYSPFFFTVPKGTYILKVESNRPNQYTREVINLLIIEYPVGDEAINSINSLKEDYDLIKMNLANIIEGKINYRNDFDVYVINIEESGDYYTHLQGDLMKINCFDENGELKPWLNGHLYLEEGIYYLVLYSWHEYDDYTLWYEKAE